jgi:AraC-like DNA-binding protein/quercetin dioxygenase-like cupin family protein
MSAGDPIFQEYFLLPKVETGAIWRYAASHRKPFHFHGHLEFLLILKGRAVERIGNRMHVLHSGQLVWHLPSIAHQMISASRDLDIRVIHAEPDVGRAMAGESFARNPFGRWAPGGTVGEVQTPSSFSRWMRDLGWLATKHPVVELRRSEVDQLLEDCDSTFADGPPASDPAPRLHRLLQNAWRSTVENCKAERPNAVSELATCLLLEDPTLDRHRLCRLLDVSDGYLSRCFQRELGTRLVDQRARIRVSHFVTGVVREKQNLLAAALSAGFGSYSQLHRTFSSLVGMSPTDYLRRGGRQTRARAIA